MQAKMKTIMMDALKQEKIFVLMVGMPGSGKTTFVLDTFPTYPGQSWNYISFDAFIEGKAMQEKKTYTEVFKQYVNEAQRACFRIAGEGLEKGHSIIGNIAAQEVVIAIHIPIEKAY